MTRQKVLVGMSGGVDSSLSAALLVEQGFDVTGVFLKVWSEEEFGADSPADELGLRNPWSVPIGACPWEKDLADARAVANALGIELIIKNVQRAYWDRVVAEFLAGYDRGHTPNPDILCNSQVKFGLLYDWAMSEGFDFLATGHYARIAQSEPVSGIGYSVSRDDPKYQLPTTKYQLHRGIDERKDQTYFLWQIDRSRLDHILFPIGHLTKDEVRAEAAKRALATAAKKDSQGICFLGTINVREWLRQELQPQAGEVVLADGSVVGVHNGVQLYTLGQRHGFTVDRDAKYKIQDTKTDRPSHYVIKRDVPHNQLVVSSHPPQQRELHATKLNWLAEPPKTGDWVEARIRHGQAPARAWISGVTDTQLLLEFADPQTAIAPGQSVVLTQDSLVLGGGIIE